MVTRRFVSLLITSSLQLLIILPLAAQTTSAPRLAGSAGPRVEKVEGSRGMVVCISPEAADVGAKILRQGGNAVDAAVATAFAMAVTFPEAGNIGGGGFMLVWPGEGREPTCIDYRETAPAACRADTFVDETATLGPKTVGVPGTVRGLELAHKKFGKLPWKQLVEPAVLLAAEGFRIDVRLASDLNRLIATHGKEFPEFARVFAKSTTDAKAAWREGDTLALPDLAVTLNEIAAGGPDLFYLGRTAQLLSLGVRIDGGFITLDDLKAYRAIERRPVHGTFRGYDLYSSPPPSSGGTVIVEMLNILEQFPLKEHGRYSTRTLHLTTEAMRRAYADRARYLGDPDFTEIPKYLTTKDHAKKLAATIDLDRATPSTEVAPEIELAKEGDSTTHFSIVDGDGMAVANTYTLQNSFGSLVVVPGCGFILNNEMTDFNWRPGVTDRKGRIGTPANQIAPGKRMLSSQSPTLVAKNGKLVLVTGSPGGRTIPNTVLNVLLNVLEFEMDVDAAVAAPRTHHQWFPDVLRFEGADDPAYAATIAELRKLGHTVDEKPSRQGDAHSILLRDGKVFGAADVRRTPGRAAAE
jgi:gamma-glutamyltranspeptidase/glutathione hydrolase